ncbi:MAG: DNA polymerase, partial [Victivallaceae bacterium]
LEMPLCEVLANMEFNGMKLDRRMLLDLQSQFSGTLSTLESEIHQLAGEKFNLNSPKQLGKILFTKLKLPPGKKTKSGYSTDVEVLQKLHSAHPVVDKILDYRQISKLKSTYVEGLLNALDESDKIHTTFKMTVTATGRLSSTDPNLQNIPVRSAMGGELRKVFIPEKTGNFFVSGDYSQVELRILAIIANDQNMQQAFRNNEDIHTVTAREVFNVPANEVTPELRRRAKAVNFGIVYGISAYALSEDLNISKSEAESYIQKYFERYPGVKNYLASIVDEAKNNGFVTTMFGRKRAIPELKNKNFAVRSFGERIAMNTPIQGSAADIIKLAMLNLFRAMRQQNLESKLIMQIHDELLLDVIPQELE